MLLNTEEMDKLAHLWEFHRRGVGKCVDPKDIKIELRSGGGIVTQVMVTCGCGREMDVTDYHSC